MPLENGGDNDLLPFLHDAKINNTAKIKMSVVHADDELILMFCNQRKETNAIFANLAILARL